MEYERASCCLSIHCPGAYPVTVLIAILPVPSLVSNVIEYLVFQHVIKYYVSRQCGLTVSLAGDPSIMRILR